MKRVLKGAEPGSLQTYRQDQPQASWDELKDDALHGGKQAYADIRTQTHRDQGGLCAYCEVDIRDNNPLKSRIEHFHPKSDTTTPHKNWALDWGNMLAVCAGGSYRHGAPPYTLEPLDKNLSCDAHKDRLIQQGALAKDCEGWVLDPSQLPVWPRLLKIQKFTGELSACPDGCNQSTPWPNNQHADMASLVEYTIQALNLNCPRLCEARLVVIRDIERNKKKQREVGYTAQQGLTRLAQRYLRANWPGFFTTICLCLGSAADDYLRQGSYAG